MHVAAPFRPRSRQFSGCSQRSSTRYVPARPWRLPNPKSASSQSTSPRSERLRTLCPSDGERRLLQPRCVSLRTLMTHGRMHHVVSGSMGAPPCTHGPSCPCLGEHPKRPPARTFWNGPTPWLLQTRQRWVAADNCRLFDDLIVEPRTVRLPWQPVSCRELHARLSTFAACGIP